MLDRTASYMRDDFDSPTSKERKIASTIEYLSKLLKLSIALCVSVLFVLERDHECGEQARGLFLALLVIMWTDLALYALATIALVLPPGCLTACFLIFYTIVKWFVRTAIIAAGITLDVEYFGYECPEDLHSLTLFFVVVLTIFASVYLLFGCCLAGSCICALSGLTNTTVANERTGSILVYMPDD